MATKKASKAKKAPKASKAIPANKAIEASKLSEASKLPEAPEATRAPEALKRKPGRPRKWTEEKIMEVGEELWAWFQVPENLFYNKFLAVRGLHPQRISEFQSVSSAFAEIIKKCNALQEVKLMEAGMSKEASRSQMFAIACLNNKHGWAHKSESKSTNITTVRVEDLAKMKQLPDEQLTDSLRWLTEPRRQG